MSLSCAVGGALTGVGGGAEGALHPPALPVQTAAVHEGDLGPQQRTLADQVRRDVLPAEGQVLVWRTDDNITIETRFLFIFSLLSFFIT